MTIGAMMSSINTEIDVLHSVNATSVPVLSSMAARNMRERLVEGVMRGGMLIYIWDHLFP